jgi:hypothetical protein
VSLHPQEALLQQARALQHSEAFIEYRKRRQVAEHRLARLVQLGIRQARYFGRVKTLFQLLLAATVANLTLVAARVGMMQTAGHQSIAVVLSCAQRLKASFNLCHVILIIFVAATTRLIQRQFSTVGFRLDF